MLKIHAMGTAARHDSSFTINRPDGCGCCLFLFVRSKAVFTVDGKEIYTEPNTYVFYRPTTPNVYHAVDDDYMDDWIHFDTDMFVGDVYADYPIYVGNAVDVTGFCELMEDAFVRGNMHGCEHIMRAMLCELEFIADNEVCKSAYYPALAQLAREIRFSPEKEWNIGIAAERLCVSKTYFQRLFKDAFGDSFGSYIIKCRIDAAQELLRVGGLNVSEIAYKCGYSNPAHFTRQFTKQSGMSPVRWREQVRKKR